MTRTAATLIHKLGLEPHPEGGHFRELYRSAMPVATDDGRVERTALTAIYFLLDVHEHSRLHRVLSDEIWHHVDGAPMQLVLVSPDLATAKTMTIGPLADANVPFAVVPAGWWQAARPIAGYSLCSCFVAPGFDFADFSFMVDPRELADVRERHPDVVPLL
jgi:predicted cupin superfamily sugar epimerase